jgi:hypothetical protein
MRVYRYLHSRPKGRLFLLSWCLFATTFSISCKSYGEFLGADSFSAMQRSNFLTIDPSYERYLLEQIKDRRTKFLWKYRFEGEGLSTADNINSQNVGGTVQGRLSYDVMDSLTFNARINLTLQSGRSQDIFGDLEPRSGIYPRALNLDWQPVKDRLSLKAGQIHQRWFNEPLFLGNLGFPGLQQRLVIYEKEQVFSLKATTQQLIPTSSTLATRVAEREPTPQLYTSTLQGQYKFSPRAFVDGSVTHYNYSRLPNIVAYESCLYGNSVISCDPRSSQFEYDFNGYMTQLTFEYSFTRAFTTQLNWNIIKNLKAPDDLGEAEAIRVSAAYDFGRWTMGGSYKSFFVEADAVPGFYNSHRLGHTNRIGNQSQISLESKDWGVIFRAAYIKADLLTPSTVVAGLQQDDQQTFFISMETLYEFL